jgi:hypothetical protein
MDVVSVFGNYLLSVWLWGMTWGIYHTPFAIFFLFFALKLFTRTSVVSALLLSIVANAISSVVFALFIRYVLVGVLDFVYIPETPQAKISEHMCFIALSLAVVYSMLQAIFFACVRTRYALPLSRVITLCCVANGLAAWCVCLLLPLYC